VLSAERQNKNVLRGDVAVEIGPLGVGVGRKRTVYHDLTGQSIVDVSRREGEFRSVHIRGENDSVIAETDFHHIGDAIGSAGTDGLKCFYECFVKVVRKAGTILS